MLLRKLRASTCHDRRNPTAPIDFPYLTGELTPLPLPISGSEYSYFQVLQLLPGAAAPSTHEEKRPSQQHKAALPELEVVGDVQVQGLGPDGAKSRSSPSGTTPEGRFAVRTVPDGGRVWVGGKESMPTAEKVDEL